MGVPELLLIRREGLKESIRDDVLNPNKPPTSIIRIVDSTLAEVLVEAVDKMVRLNLTTHVMTVKRKRAYVLAELLDGLQRLHHLGPFVYHVLHHRHRLSWCPLIRPSGRHFNSLFSSLSPLYDLFHLVVLFFSIIVDCFCVV